MAAQKFELLASVALPGTGSLVFVYRCPVGRRADVNINIANRTDVLTSIRLVHVKNGTVASAGSADFLLGGTTEGLPTSALAHNMSPIEKNGVAMSAGDEIGVSSSVNNVAVHVNGIEEDA